MGTTYLDRFLIVGIIGSRSRDSDIDYELVEKAFFNIPVETHKSKLICSGGCSRGADRFAKKIHTTFRFAYLEFPSNWDLYGKAAGFIRNTDIANMAQILIACVSKNRIGGTEDTIRKYLTLRGLAEEAAVASGELIII